MLSDVQFFKSRIDKLDGADDLGDHLVSVVKSKTIIGLPASIPSSEMVSGSSSPSPPDSKTGEPTDAENQS